MQQSLRRKLFTKSGNGAWMTHPRAALLSNEKNPWLFRIIERIYYPDMWEL